VLKHGPYVASEKQNIKEAIANYGVVSTSLFHYAKLSDEPVERGAQLRWLDRADFQRSKRQRRFLLVRNRYEFLWPLI